MMIICRIESKCNTVYEDQCRTLFETKTEKQCKDVPKEECRITHDRVCTQVLEKQVKQKKILGILHL